MSLPKREEVRMSMQDNKGWNGIRAYVDYIFDETDIGNSAKKFADKVVDNLKEVDISKKNKVNDDNQAAKSNKRSKAYLKTNRVASTIKIWVGLPMMIMFAIPIIILTLTLLPFSFIGWLIPIIPLATFCIIGGILSIPAIFHISLTDRAQRYYRIMNDRTYMNIEDMAIMANESPQFVENNLKKMIEKKIFLQGHLLNKCFMLTDDTYRECLAIEEEKRRNQVDNKNNIRDDIKESVLISEGREYVATIRKLHQEINKEPMSSKLTKLETVLIAIFDRVGNEPKEEEKLYKLMKYYLPTSIKLINTYKDFDNVISPDSDILNTKKEIELTIDSINEACEEFQNRLFKNSAFDADTDAVLLKVMLAKDGLIGGIQDENNGR